MKKYTSLRGATVQVKQRFRTRFYLKCWTAMSLSMQMKSQKVYLPSNLKKLPYKPDD